MVPWAIPAHRMVITDEREGFDGLAMNGIGGRDMKGNNPSYKETPSDPVFSVCWNGPLPEPSVMTAEDLRGVLANPECTCKGGCITCIAISPVPLKTPDG